MKTISIIAKDRPAYFAKTIQRLSETGVDLSTFDRLIFSIEPGNKDVMAIAVEARNYFNDTGRISAVVLKNQELAGVANHPLMVLKHAFEVEGSWLHLSLEDDACVTRDALTLVNWYNFRFGGATSPYTLLSLCNHNDFGRGTNPGYFPHHPNLYVESPFIMSPFAWATTKYQWPFIKSVWNCKKVHPVGWDWSLSYGLVRTHRRTIHPVMSRCMNIGREGGTNESPDSFDSTQLGLAYSRKTAPSKMRLVGRLMPEPYRLERGMRSIMLDDFSVATFGETNRWHEPEFIRRQIFPKSGDNTDV